MSDLASSRHSVSAPGAVLVVAAHPDDEVLGCGGTVARLASEGSRVHVLLLADGETSRRPGLGSASPALAERNAAYEAARAILGCASVQAEALPDQRLDSLELLDLVQRIERVIAHHRPAMVLTHHAGDVNLDHRLVHDAVVSACRPQPGHAVRELLFFEVPSSTEWRPPGSAPAFTPNWFVDVSGTLPTKMRALEAYARELRPFPHPRSIEAIEALAKWRGASVGVHAAEAFMLGRKVL